MAGRIWMPEQMMKGHAKLGTSSELRVRVFPSIAVRSDSSKKVDRPIRVWFVKFDFCSGKPQAPSSSELGKKGRTNRETELTKKE